MNGLDCPIIGVDFSGARHDRGTAIACGTLSGHELRIADCRTISREALLQTLLEAPPGSVAALDFPFSVPEKFVRELAGDPRTMADVWSGVADMEMDAYVALRDRFVSLHGELDRKCDILHPEAYSVLHRVNPNMLPMTLKGMQLLRRLRRPGIAILALDEPAPKGLTVIEVMPGASLKGMGLPYKGYKTGMRRLELRRVILEGLAKARPICIGNVEEIRSQCEDSHDCLDAVVAALTAATFLAYPELVSTPSEGDIYRLEGWIYALEPVGPMPFGV